MGSIYRNTYRQLMEQVVGMQIAAQGDSKAMKKYLKDLEKLANQGIAPVGNDAQAFKKLLGKKGGI